MADPDAMLLSGKVAIVTEGATGIGRACAARLAAEGARVVIADANDPLGSEAAQAIAEAGGQIRFVHANSAERLDVHNLIATTLEAYGFVDILVTTANADIDPQFLEMSEEQFDRVVRKNVKGTFLCAQAVARQFIRQIDQGRHQGVIITTASASLETPQTGSASAASIGAIARLTQSMASDLADHGIRINAIGPDTKDAPDPENGVGEPKDAPVPEAEAQAQRQKYFEDVAELTAWLVSDRAKHISGETVYVGDRRMLLST